MTCYTCDKKIPYTEAHLGHFKHGKLDFDFYFTQIQCAGCNLFKHGKLDVYAERLINQYGLELFNMKVREANTHPGYSTDDLNKIINLYGTHNQ